MAVVWLYSWKYREKDGRRKREGGGGTIGKGSGELRETRSVIRYRIEVA